MTATVQRKRGTTAQHALYAGPDGEITVDSSKATVIVHDGVTAGGRPLAREDLANVLPSVLQTRVGLTTDGTFADSSDSAIPSQKAVKTYADAREAGAKAYAESQAAMRLHQSVLSTDGTMAALSDSLIPSQKAVAQYVATHGGGGGMTYDALTSDSTAIVDHGYVATGSSLISLTIPASPAALKTIEIVALGAGGVKLLPASGQTIVYNGASYEAGMAVFLSSGAVLRLLSLDGSSWSVVWAMGNITTGAANADPFWSFVSLLLPFDGTFADLSGNGVSLTANAVGFVSGKTGQAASFNGTSSSVSAAAAVNATKFYDDDFTMEAWVKPAAGYSSDNRGIISTQTATGSATGLALYCKSGTGYLAFGRPGVDEFVSAVALAVGVYSHVALSKIGSLVRLYLNGTEILSASMTALMSDGGLRIGAMATGGYWLGDIDLLRVTCGLGRYAANFTPVPSYPTAGDGSADPFACLTSAVFRFDGSLQDAGTNAIPMVNNGVTLATDIVKTGTGSGLFNGSSSYASAASAGPWTRFYGPFAIEFWVYPTNIAGDRGIFDCRAVGSGGGFVVYLSNGELRLWDSNGKATGATIPANTWTHILVMRGASRVRVFVNGVQVGTPFTLSTSCSDGALCLGRDNAAQVNYFAGYIDMVRISNGTARVGSNFTPATTQIPTNRPNRYEPTWGRTALACRFNGTAADSSGNGLAVTASTMAYSSGKFAQAAQFNGTSSSVVVSTPGSAAKFYGDYTVEFWASLNPNGTAQTLFDSRSTIASTAGLHVSLGVDNKIRASAAGAELLAASPLTAGWHHIAQIRSGTVGLLFIDGVLVASGSMPGILADGNIRLGSQVDGSQALASDTLLDDWLITHAAKYTANFTPESSSFIAQSA